MTSSVLYLEPVGGIAGDMFLAAALDLGVPLDALEKPLRTLGVSGWSFKVTRQERHHIGGTHVDVVVDHHHDEPHHHEHDHRALSDITQLIKASGLSDGAKANALRVFGLIGEAEAKIHQVPLESIHFHEVGAVDSIIDICGAAIALEWLGNPTVYCAPPPLGSGTAKMAHGVVPIPPPATLELLKGYPARFEGEGELTTPTGAAFIRAYARVEAPPPMTVDKVGYGLGTRDWKDRANVLRATLGTRTLASTRDSDTVWVLETNLDDSTPQLIGALLETLMERGALDVTVVPALMKKGRPGHVLSVLSHADQREALTALMLAESTSLGVRMHPATRSMLSRRFEDVETPFGRVRMKIGFDATGVVNASPELEDARALAKASNVALKTVLAAAVAAWTQAATAKAPVSK